MKLTVTNEQCEEAVFVEGKTTILRAGRCLYLHPRLNGVKAWIFRKHVNGITFRGVIGYYPEMSNVGARLRADVLMRMLVTSFDPPIPKGFVVSGKVNGERWRSDRLRKETPLSEIAEMYQPKPEPWGEPVLEPVVEPEPVVYVEPTVEPEPVKTPIVALTLLDVLAKMHEGDVATTTIIKAIREALE